MREILFRGKRIDNGEWVEGHLYTQVYCPGTIEEEWYWIIKPIGSETWVNYRVDHSAVGQYTGLKDKHGKRIFEGDIIRTHYANTRKNDFVEQVVFHNGRFCSLGKIPGPGNGKIWAALPDGVPHLVQDKTPYMIWCEVIGNIHDNPELLEGGRDE